MTQKRVFVAGLALTIFMGGAAAWREATSAPPDHPIRGGKLSPEPERRWLIQALESTRDGQNDEAVDRALRFVTER